MRLSKIIFGLMLLFAFRAAAQKDNFPQAFEIDTDTAAYVKIPDAHWQFLDAGEASFKKIVQPEFSKKFRKGMKGVPYGKYWFRYRVKNHLNHPLNITIPAFGVDMDFYILGPAGKWEHFRNGSNVPWSRRDGLKKIQQVTYTIKPHEEITVYQKDAVALVNAFHPTIGIKENVISGEYIENDHMRMQVGVTSFLFGFLVFAALVNLFFFHVIRERVYLVYGVMLIFTAVCVFLDNIFHMFFRENPVAFRSFSLVVIGILICLMSFTTLMFLRVSKNHPRWHKAMVAATLLLLALLMLSFFTSETDFFLKYSDIFNAASRGLLLFLIAGVLIIIAIDLYKKERSARLFILAVVPFLFWMVIIFSNSERFPFMEDFLLLCIIWAVSVMSWSLFERFRKVVNENMQQALDKERLAREKEEERNELIAKQKELLEQQVAERTMELTQSLADLKQTQNQLIQSEKMASLGELTAGIAHEIQNPLNFVNNFSDVSVELLQELKEEAEKGDLEEVKALADDVTQNLEKIAHHGRRAEGIVKGMLQHSRASSGQKEPTDMNALADEYLRLAYHGLRAKDKSFNAELITYFDEDLPKINIVPQDVGRVLLNLFTNAFYATQQKSLQSQSQSVTSRAAGMPYKPTITVRTKQIGNSVQIIVKDNGTGIPAAIKDKILQPFFTTKPTGEGTGLGLSLSYDIIVKGHGGSISIDSKEGEYSEFIIALGLGTS